jgi:plasmid stabilization system protein ParE
MPSIRYRPPVASDVEEIVAWYESRKEGLGLEFDELDHVLNRAANRPLQFPVVYKSVRRALLRRFPYSVYFLIGRDGIEAVAILHQRRHPNEWRSRI